MDVVGTGDLMMVKSPVFGRSLASRARLFDLDMQNLFTRYLTGGAVVGISCRVTEMVKLESSGFQLAREPVSMLSLPRSRVRVLIELPLAGAVRALRVCARSEAFIVLRLRRDGCLLIG